MRKLILIGIALMVFLGSVALAETSNSTPITSEPTPTVLKWNNSAGWDMPTFGWVIRNDEGQITGVQGINIGLGYSAKYYFKPLKTNSFNPYWGWGTFLLLIPYAVVGGDYVMDSGFYIGGYAGVNLLTLLTFIPTVSVSVGFYF